MVDPVRPSRRPNITHSVQPIAFTSLYLPQDYDEEQDLPQDLTQDLPQDYDEEQHFRTDNVSSQCTCV